MNRIVTLGEIMVRIATPGHARFAQAFPGKVEVTFAGAEASIAAGIAYLGGQSSFATALPTHPIADACVANLRALGVDTSRILRTDLGRLGVFYLEVGANQRPSNVIYDREGSSVAITPTDSYDWDAIFADATWFVISGITPAISANGAAVSERAIHEAAKRGILIACDMNYRSKLWKWQPPLTSRELATKTMRSLLPQIDMFIGGLEDAAEVLGIPCSGHTAESYPEVAQKIANQFPKMKWVAMTRRQGFSANHNNFGGFLLDVAQSKSFFAPQANGEPSLYEIEAIVDRLGAGDAFTAGLLFALNDTSLNDPQSALRFATAAGCLAHSIEGDYNYVSRAEIESLMNGDESGRVMR